MILHPSQCFILFIEILLNFLHKTPGVLFLLPDALTHALWVRSQDPCAPLPRVYLR